MSQSMGAGKSIGTYYCSPPKPQSLVIRQKPACMTEIYLQFMCAHGQTSWGRPLMASSCTVYRVQLLREHASEALACAKTCMTDIDTIS